MKKRTILSAVAGAIAATSAAIALKRFVSPKRREDEKVAKKNDFIPPEYDFGGIEFIDGNVPKKIDDTVNDVVNDEPGTPETDDGLDVPKADEGAEEEAGEFITPDAIVRSIPRAGLRVEFTTEGHVYSVSKNGEVERWKSLAWPTLGGVGFDIYVYRKNEYIVLLFIETSNKSRFLRFGALTTIDRADYVMVLNADDFSPYNLSTRSKKKSGGEIIGFAEADGRLIGENVAIERKPMELCPSWRIESLTYVVEDEVYVLPASMVRRGFYLLATFSAGAHYVRTSVREFLEDLGECYRVVSRPGSDICEKYYVEGEMLKHASRDFDKFLEVYEADKRNPGQSLLATFYDTIDAKQARALQHKS